MRQIREVGKEGVVSVSTVGMSTVEMSRALDSAGCGQRFSASQH